MTSAVPPAAPFFRNSRRSSVPAGDMEASVSNPFLSGCSENRLPNGSSQIFHANRQAAKTLARSVKDGITDGGCNHGNGRLADAGRRLGAGHEVNFDRRSFVHADHFIVVEIGLHNATALDGNAAPHQIAEFYGSRR